MKKSISLFMALAMAAGLGAHATTISSDEALARVVAQWNATNAHRAPMQANILTLAETGNTPTAIPSYYIFTRAGGGFVVAPADDARPAILAYVDEGSYDAEKMPPAFHAWLEEILKYGAADSSIASSKMQKTGADDDFLLGDIVWTQEYPMNANCPTYNYYGYNYSTYAGCVAIALGQIMRFHQHPQQGTGNIAYSTDTYSLPVATNLDDHTYDWSKILPNYVYTQSTSAEREEVARFVYDVAAACHMDFSPAASNSQDFRAAQALKRNFHYDASLQLVDHGNYSTAQWAQLLRDEIDARRPVYISGANVQGSNSEVAGHAFVIDGYNAEGYFHVNWGWNGSSNGYYLLTDLTPKDKQGAGGSAAGYAFMQNAIVGIQPDKGGAETPASLCLIYDQIWTERDAQGDAVHFYIANPSATDFSGMMALRITDANGSALNDPIATALKTTCKAGFGGERAWYIDLKSLGNRAGMVFEIVYREDGTETWNVAGSRAGSPHSLVSYKTAGGSVALQPNPSEMFQMRLADLKADAPLKPSTTTTFTARVKNESDYEYFAPLYLMVYDASEALIGYTDYQLYIVPAHGESEVKFNYTLPKDEGSYHFCVAYETLGYNYDYSPMLREGEAAYDYVFNVSKDGGENPGGGEVDPGDGSVQNYVLECIDYGADAVRRDVKVRFEGREVYIQGISEEVPDGWAHATLDDGVAIFETPLLLGEWNYYGSIRKQYITGADTGTGDVSGLTLYYDDETRSFTSFSNNWILLTGDPTQVGYYYDHLYNSVSIIPSNNATDRTVTPPDGLATSTYQLCGRNPYSGIPTDYTLNVGYDGKDVYVQGLYPAFPNAWIKGTIADGKATFKTPQYIGNYHGLYNMYIAGVEPVKEELCALVMNYDAASHTFTTTDDCWFIVQAGETNVLPMMLLDAVSIAPYSTPALDYSDLALPAELTDAVRPYSLSAINADDNSTVTRNVNVAISGREVYIQGLSTYFPNAWVRGTIGESGITVFQRNQHMGKMEGYEAYDIWLGAGDTMSGEMLYGNFLLIYDAAKGTFTQPEINYLAINASTTKVYHLELLKGVQLTPSNVDGIGSLTATSLLPLPSYDLQGRRVVPSAHGFYIHNGRKSVR